MCTCLPQSRRAARGVHEHAPGSSLERPVPQALHHGVPEGKSRIERGSANCQFGFVALFSSSSSDFCRLTFERISLGVRERNV